MNKPLTKLQEYALEFFCGTCCIIGTFLIFLLYIAATDPQCLRDWVAQ